MVTAQKLLASGNLATITFVATLGEVLMQADYAHPPSERDKAEVQDICTIMRAGLKSQFGKSSA